MKGARIRAFLTELPLKAVFLFRNKQVLDSMLYRHTKRIYI